MRPRERVATGYTGPAMTGSSRSGTAERSDPGSAAQARELPETIHGFASYRKAIPSAQADLEAILEIARAMVQAVDPIDLIAS